MARIRYKNKEGESLPGVTTILNVLNKPALLWWAWKEGAEGRDLYEKRDKAADAGTLCHQMIEAHLKGLPEPPVPEDFDKEQRGRAEGGFLAFLEWEKAHSFRLLESERSLVSEKYGYGGTIDIGAIVNDTCIVDIKTSKDVYVSMKIQVAAYQNLWNENHPENPARSCHILRVGEDGGFSHHYFPDLSAEWEMFLHCLEIHKLLQKTKQRL